MSASPLLRAQLARRLREQTPPQWHEFTNHWIAFNALYGGELDDGERARVMSTIRKHVSSQRAVHILNRQAKAIAQILALPPGDMRVEVHDPRFREASRRCARLYRSTFGTPQSRLAGVGGTLYQVRCNLIHGSKDPNDSRDRMLVRESLAILRDLVPAVEIGMTDEFP